MTRFLRPRSCSRFSLSRNALRARREALGSSAAVDASDFLIVYDGGMHAVELDGHEYHKTKEQRERDAKRDRWFNARKIKTLRWTGSEVKRNPQACVQELRRILSEEMARP